MSTVAEILLQDGADALRSRVMSVSELSPSDRAFLAWALYDDTPRDDLAILATTATTNLATTRSYHDLATIGYAAHAAGLTDVQAQALRNGLNWLRGRNPRLLANQRRSSRTLWRFSGWPSALASCEGMR